MKIKRIEGKLAKSGKKYPVTLSREIVDRDNEIISIDGMNIDNFKANPVLLDAHNMHGSVVDNVLGRVEDIRKTIDDAGVKVLQGILKFADTPRALIAKSLVDGGFVNTVSVGFNISDYDRKNAIATKSELYELSLVSVPANIGATIGAKGMKADEIGGELVKKLKNYEEIHPTIKEYRKNFMSKELCELIGYEKTGDEANDIANIYKAMTELIIGKQETPVNEKTVEENPNEVSMTMSELVDMIAKVI